MIFRLFFGPKNFFRLKKGNQRLAANNNSRGCDEQVRKNRVKKKLNQKKKIVKKVYNEK